MNQFTHYFLIDFKKRIIYIYTQEDKSFFDKILFQIELITLSFLLKDKPDEFFESITAIDYNDFISFNFLNFSYSKSQVFDITDFYIIYKDDTLFNGINHYRTDNNDSPFLISFYDINEEKSEDAEKKIQSFSLLPDHAQIKSFQLRGEPELIHFIKTGWKDKYFVCQENAYETKPDGKDFLMTKEEIKTKFNIEL